jgi:hypothetical protein
MDLRLNGSWFAQAQPCWLVQTAIMADINEIRKGRRGMWFALEFMASPARTGCALR